jgi:hypothetical protein
MIVYPLEFHRRAAQKWANRVQPPGISKSSPPRSRVDNRCPKCKQPMIAPFESAYLAAEVIEHHWVCKHCSASWTSRVDPLLV